MGAGKRVGQDISGGGVQYAAYAQTEWAIIHTDLKAAKPADSVLLRPATYSDTNVRPVRVPPTACRVLLRARYATAISLVGTNPIMAVYGVYGPESGYTESTGAFADDGTMRFIRLDLSIGYSGATTGAYSCGMDATNDLRDGTYKYGAIAGDYAGNNSAVASGLDLRGCKWVFALTVTPASVTGAGAVELEAGFISAPPMAYSVVV